MTRLTRRLIALVLIFTVGLTPAWAATPVQANPNNTLFPGVDSSTGNAAAPYINHTTGAMTVTTVDASGVSAVSTGATGASAPAAATQIGGADPSGNLRVLTTSASGILNVSTESNEATYAAAIVDISPAASATDVTCLTGSATKTIYVTRVQFSADANTSASVDVLLIKRTAANTGAASSVTMTTYDSNDPAATAAVNQYNANPSVLGAGVTIRADELGVALDVNGYPNSPLIWDFGSRSTKYVVLRGATQQLCVNLNGIALPTGLAAYVDFEWKER